MTGRLPQEGAAPPPNVLRVTRSGAARSRQSDARTVREVHALFEEGRFTESAALYDGVWQRSAAPIEASMVRARIYLRTDVPKAVALLNRTPCKKGSSEQVWRDLLLGEAYALLDDYDAADARFDDAFEVADRLGDSALIAQVAYRLGRRRIMAGDPKGAREALVRMQRSGSPASRLDTLHLESFILSREGRLADQARVLTELLRAIDPNSSKEMEHRAWATHSLAALAREIWVPEAVPEVERQLGGIEWPAEFVVNRFQAFKALAWAKALNGDYFNAFRYLSKAGNYAPSTAWQTMVHCDRAYLAAATGEPRWSRQEIVEAEESAARTDWRACRDEEAVALLLLAELLAPIDPARASEYLATYHSLRDSAPARSLLRRDPRNEALGDYAAAVVDASLGQSKTAKNRLRRAREVYKQLRYDWRAARCELQLYRLSPDPALLKSAEDLLSHYGSSWLAGELRTLGGATASSELSPMQDRVFRYICEGLSNAEIAARLGRSENTVANHAKAVLKTFGVSNRPALIALALKRGLL